VESLNKRSYFVPHFRLALEEGPCYPPGFARAHPGQFNNARLLSSTILVQADNPRRPVNIYDGSDAGSYAWPSPTVLGGIPGRIPSDRLSAPLHGLMVSRYRGGRAVIPAPGRQEFHLHESEVIKEPWLFVANPCTRTLLFVYISDERIARRKM
jgi:hypothetical protein